MTTGTPEFWKVFKATEGALSCSESIAIINIAALAPEGLYLELGTHKGKSALSAISELKNGAFYLLDPIFEDEQLRLEIEEKIALFDLSNNNSNSIIALAKYSTDFIIEFAAQHNFNDYAYVFVDSGSHGDGLPMQEVKLLEDRMVKGGIIAMHDYKNQFTEVELAYDYLVSTGKYEPTPINWKEIFDYVAENNLEEGNNSWHLYPELGHPPNFVGALKRK
jgi:hypothetical protein